VPFGDPALDATVSGPLIDASNAERVAAWVEEAIGQGAKKLVGGAREGSVVPPALLESAPPTARVVAEEVFGPVVVLERAASTEEAIARAGDTRFGLQCGIFTNDIGALMRAWDVIEVGALIHNDAPAFRVDLIHAAFSKESVAKGLARL
jgi:aldehyde dehydrogenase (NAD+)